MKILSVHCVTSVIVNTYSDEFPIYRRDSNSNWWNLMGSSWETACGDEAELESLYQEYILNHPVDYPTPIK